jgi:hypothetical protein
MIFWMIDPPTELSLPVFESSLRHVKAFAHLYTTEVALEEYEYESEEKH